MDKGEGDKTHAAAASLLLLPLKNPLKLTFKSRPPLLSQCEYNYGKFPRPPPPLPPPAPQGSNTQGGRGIHLHFL